MTMMMTAAAVLCAYILFKVIYLPCFAEQTFFIIKRVAIFGLHICDHTLLVRSEWMREQ